MSERSTEATERPAHHDVAGTVPPADVIEFIRYCHHRRRAGWPELYDEMCGVAARREFHGWGHEQLAARGLTFSLLDMPRLAGWVRMVLASTAQPADPHVPHAGGNLMQPAQA